jgi:hypothetical protein
VTWWRRALAEAAGAFRSLRYDLTRRSGPRHDTTDILYPEYDAYEPDDRPRRAATATAVGLVLAAAVVGVYLAVAGGMGALLAYGSPGSPSSVGPSATPSRSAAPAHVPAASPAGASPSPSPSPSRSPRATRTPTRRPITHPPTTAPAPPPTETNSPSPLPSPSVTGADLRYSGETRAEQP